MSSRIVHFLLTSNKEGGSVKIITYIAGDAYTAPIAHIKQKGGSTIDEYHYLHRDYLGSILAITDSSGAIKEQRQFGAWGEVDRFVDSSGNTIFNHSSLIGRGYTGHEHFFEVSLIHMNGRMYDASLGRFLAPDNFIQEPFNTQSFNRYGYVWNNPLAYVDWSGESFLKKIGKFFEKNWKTIVTAVVQVAVTVAVAAAITATVVATGGAAAPFLIGAISGAAGGFAGGVLGSKLNGGNLQDSLKAGGLGAAFGLISGGLGSVAAAFAPAGILNGALYGGVTGSGIGGIIDLMSGGDGWSGAISGFAFGVIGGAATGYINAVKSGLNVWTGKELTKIQFGNPNVQNQIHHAERHVRSAGANLETVQNAVRKDIYSNIHNLKNVGDGVRKNINVNGVNFEYRAHKISSDVINVGTIFSLR